MCRFNSCRRLNSLLHSGQNPGGMAVPVEMEEVSGKGCGGSSKYGLDISEENCLRLLETEVSVE